MFNGKLRDSVRRLTIESREHCAEHLNEKIDQLSRHNNSKLRCRWPERNDLILHSNKCRGVVGLVELAQVGTSIKTIIVLIIKVLEGADLVGKIIRGHMVEVVLISNREDLDTFDFELNN